MVEFNLGTIIDTLTIGSNFNCEGKGNFGEGDRKKHLCFNANIAIEFEYW